MILQAIIDVAAVALIWYFFGPMWGVLAIFGCLVGFWASLTNRRLKSLEADLAAIRRRVDSAP